MRVHTRLAEIAITVVVVVSLASPTPAEQLPIKPYSSSDGLVNDRVKHVIEDAWGFIWISTTGGIVRFDGNRFTTFDVDDGLPVASANRLLITRDGGYWVATNGGGVARFNLAANPAGVIALKPQSAGSVFTHFPVGDNARSARVNELFEDPVGRIWAGTDGGLFRLDNRQGGRFESVPFEFFGTPDKLLLIWALEVDREGSLWIGSNRGLTQLLPDGRFLNYPGERSHPFGTVSDIDSDSAGRLWVSARSGVYCLLPSPPATFSATLSATGDRPWQRLLQAGLPATAAEARRFSRADGLASNQVASVLLARDGKVWVTAAGGVSVYDGREFKTYDRANGLSSTQLGKLFEDRSGNIWIPSTNAGVMKLSRKGFVNYHSRDGLASDSVISFVETRDDLYAVTVGWTLNRWINGTWRRTSLEVPGGGIQLTNRPPLLDRSGEWWVPTLDGVFHFPRITSKDEMGVIKPRRVLRQTNGLADDNVNLVFEDSRGDYWFTYFGADSRVMSRMDRATGRFTHYGEADGLPGYNAPTKIVEDRHGNLWIGFREGGLARYSNGRFQMIGPPKGLPVQATTSLLVARSGRVWVAGYPEGVGYIEDPGAETPQLILPASRKIRRMEARNLAEDEWGRIYFGSDYGVARYDPESDNVAQFSSTDGLVSNIVMAMLLDRRGTLWIATTDGVSRLTPEREPAPPPPRILISALRINGAPFDVPAVGATHVGLADLNFGQHQLQIDFFGLGFGSGEAGKYEYLLENADSDWGEAANERSVNFANLAPGSYRFLVRAVNASGLRSLEPASLDFRILPPIWQRWWFLTLAAGAVLAGVIAFDRYRVARLKELNRALTESRALTAQLEEQQEELQNNNRTLTLEFEIARVLAEARTPASATSLVMAAICEGIGWDAGAVWRINDDTRVVSAVAAWPIDSIAEGNFRSQSLAALCDRVTSERQAVWISEYDADGWASAVGFPVLLGAEAIGVLVFFHRERREVEPALLMMMTTIVSQTGQLLERKRVEEELNRNREERLFELERVRRRIATDLHDDIGSSLTQISILSEVVRKQVGKDGNSAAEPLSQIASVSRELIDSMSDIVWAINPQKDHLSDVIQRMRRFASDSLTARNIAFSFKAPEGAPDIRIGANVRREVFLIFKESLNNALRHSGCSAVEIELTIMADNLVLRVSDDGNGFDTANKSDGHGLVSMRDRAQGIDGDLDIQSEPGQGTEVKLRVGYTNR